MQSKYIMVQKNNWIDERFTLLFSKFGNRQFTREEAFDFLKEKIPAETTNTIDQFFYELKKQDKLLVIEDEFDKRKKTYSLKMGIEGELTKDKLISLLKKAADLIRTRVDYKFILILLFLRRISDEWKSEYDKVKNKLISDGYSEEIAKEEAKNKEYHKFDYDFDLLWDNLTLDITKLPENLSKALKMVSEKNTELRYLFSSTDFLQFTQNRDNLEILRQLVELFSSHNLMKTSNDILGDAYEWILYYFAPDKAKEGEVYTPREVIKLMYHVLDPNCKNGRIRIYDCGSGSSGMLIEGNTYILKKHPENANKVSFYGQEFNPSTYALGLMNVYIHGIRDTKIALGDTLMHPKDFGENVTGTLPKFDYICSNPPWNQDGYDENTLKKGDFVDRFSFGFSTNQSADWIWMQHILFSLTETGKAGVVIDNGCLFRGGKEGAIRQKVLEADLIEAIVLLPEKLFYNTGAPGAILFFNQNKPKERKNKIIFINASSEFDKHESVRKLNQLKDKNLETISKTIREFKDVKDLAHVVSLEEIKKNDYNLNVTLYIFPEEKKEVIDIQQELREEQEVIKELEQVDKKLAGYLRELY